MTKMNGCCEAWFSVIQAATIRDVHGSFPKTALPEKSRMIGGLCHFPGRGLTCHKASVCSLYVGTKSSSAIMEESVAVRPPDLQPTLCHMPVATSSQRHSSLKFLMKNNLRSWRRLLALAAGCLISVQIATALSITSVTSGNGLPALSVQWTDSAGQPRTAIMVKQSANGPGYLYQLTYQVNGSPRVCAGTGITGYPGDGFVENHNTQGSDNNTLDNSTPGTTTVALSGSSHAIIAFDMPTYQILGETVPTTIYWFFADGRSHPIFAISQDARGTDGNLGADTRSPYGSLNFDGGDGSSDVGGASYGDTLKFVTLAAPPELVTGLSAWRDTQANTIPYAMEWVSTNEGDAEMGHVATLPITVQDQGADRDANSTTDPRNQQASNGPMIPYGASDIGPDAWAFQLLDYILHPDYQGDGQGPGASIQVNYSKLAWGGNFGRVGGWNNGNVALNGTQYSEHFNCGANILTGARANGMLMAYSVFVVLGTHAGSYTNGAVGQEVLQMENAAVAALSASTGTVNTAGPAGVGNAASTNITYTPVGYNPIYATWEITAAGNQANVTLTPAAGKPLDHPIFVLNGYTTNHLPTVISVGAGLTNAGVNYFATLDTNNQRLWITVNGTVTSPVNLIVTNSSGAAPLPVISSIPGSGYVGASILITGQNFTGATAVAFHGVSAIFTVNSATQITASVPVGATAGTITVTTPAGTATSATIFTPQAAPGNLAIYSDTLGLVNGFQDYSWATVNDYDTAPAPVYSGTYSISVTGPAYDALSLYDPPGFDTTPYIALDFWINGGPAGAQGVQVMGVVGTTAQGSPYNLPVLASNTWVHFVIPLSALGVANITNCNGFWLWPTVNGSTTFYVDAVQLVTAAPPSLAVLTPSPSPDRLSSSLQDNRARVTRWKHQQIWPPGSLFPPMSSRLPP